MPAPEDFDAAGRLAEELTSDAPWHGYGPYLAARSRGLKREAANALDAFIADAASWPETGARAFIEWLDGALEGFLDRGVLLPFPLRTRIVLPALRRWSDEGSAYAAFMLGHIHNWKSDETAPLKYFELALERDPAMDRARAGLLGARLDHVHFNQHHLPDEYLGDRGEDIAFLNEQRGVVAGFTDPALGQPWLDEIAVLEARARGERDDGGSRTYAFKAD